MTRSAPTKKKTEKPVKSARPRRAYHHGDLRRALLDAARALIGAHGMEALTLREVAREVGVTHAAPYHHFPTREALLDALSDEAFALLDAAMRVSLPIAGDGEGASGKLSAIGRAYIDFARAHPEHLQVMFRRRSGPQQRPASDPSEQANARVFDHLLSAVQACQAEGSAPAGDPFTLALSAWSIVHGFAKLWIEGPLNEKEPYATARFEDQRDAVLRDFVGSWRARARSEARRR
ncbi:MAG: TetR/AcrR family transcriptional regulator [Polyangiales bacterium]